MFLYKYRHSLDVNLRNEKQLNHYLIKIWWCIKKYAEKKQIEF